MTKHSVIFIIVFLFQCLSVAGQKYVAESPLGKCRESGFYKIEIHPGLSKWVSDDFSNFRILDDNGREVPFITEQGSDYTTNEYIEYKLVEHNFTKGCCTNLIIENHDNKPINNVHIRIRNAEVHKSAVLSGSDDMEKWFALRDKFYFDPVTNPDGIAEMRVLDFPLSNYRFYRLTINDSISDPLNISSVGFYRQLHKAAAYSLLSPLRLSIVDSAKLKQTIICIKLDTLNWVERIKMSASGAPFFLRMGRIYQVSEARDRKRKSYEVLNYLADFKLLNDAETTIDFNAVKAKELRVVIENDDNQPLDEFKIEVLQLKRFAISHFQKDVEYKMVIGDETMRVPKYDLHHFKNRLPVNMLTMTAMEFEPIMKPTLEEETSESIFQPRYLVWGAIIVIMILLGGLSIRMIRENKVSGNL
jgi:hypothetical protein